MYGYEILHEDIMDNLIKNVRRGYFCHAYIFEGEKGIGSLEAALLFSNALICERTEVAPCGACSACILAKAGNHPDIHIISPLKDKKNILVEQIRDLSKDAYTKPFENAKKVYIIQYGDEMNEQSQNALLKLLEEPPEYAVFVILSENTESLLPTVRSRCELMKFPPVSPQEIENILKRDYPDIKNADFLARCSGGNIKKARQLAEDEDFIPLRSGAFETLTKLLSSDIYESYEIADFVEANKEHAEAILDLWTEMLRDIMLIQNGKKALAVNADYIDRLSDLALMIDEKKTVDAIQYILSAQEMLRRHVKLRTLILKASFGIKKGV